MSWIRCTGLGVVAGLYVVVGRWGFHRLLSADWEPNPLWEMRLWIALAALLLAPLGLLHMVRRAARPGETRLDVGLLTALAVFFGYFGASALWAPDAYFAFRKLYELVLAGAMTFGFALAALRQPADRVLDAFWGVVVAATALLAFVGMRQLLGGGDWSRLAVLGGGPNIFARLMGLLVLGALYFWWRRGQPWLWIPLASIGAVLALLTGSRGGVGATIAGLVTFIVVARVPLRRLAVLAALATAVVAVVPHTPVGKALDRAVEYRFIHLTLEYEGKNGSDSPVYLAGREPLYERAYELGLDNPVSGAGLAAFPALGLGHYPHNLILEVFCEGGALGLALLGCVLLAFLRSVFRERRWLDPATVGAVALFMFGSQASGDLYDSRALFLLMVMATSALAAARDTLAAPVPCVPRLGFAGNAK